MIEKFRSYSFREVKVFPPDEHCYFQLFEEGVPRPFIYSDSHLERVFNNLKDSVL